MGSTQDNSPTSGTCYDIHWDIPNDKVRSKKYAYLYHISRHFACKSGKSTCLMCSNKNFCFSLLN